MASLKMLGSIIMGRGKRARLSILIYHRVLPSPDPMYETEVDARLFARQMALLDEHFTTLPLSNALERLKNGTLPPRAVCVTFDDGYADNVSVALPILRRHKLPATFFVTTGFLNGGCMWNDAVREGVRRAQPPRFDLRDEGLGTYPVGSDEERRTAVSGLLSRLKYLDPTERESLTTRILHKVSARRPTDLMMNADQVRALTKHGMEIGGHTVSHPILARVNQATARREIVQGKETLEDISGTKVTIFAYPNGRPGKDYAREHRDTVEAAGFSAAVSTAWGVATPTTDPYQLPRFTPWDRTTARFALRLIHNATRRKVDTA